MLMTLMMMTMISTLMFMLLKHPLSMGLILLIQTIVISMIMGYFNLNYWYSYVLFLIMVGGMLILFIYMTSVASNEKFSFSIKLMSTVICITIIMMFMMYMLDPYFPSMNNLNLESINSNLDYTLSLNKYINAPMNIIMFMLIIYLLITLIAVVKITFIKGGTLRQSN